MDHMGTDQHSKHMVLQWDPVEEMWCVPWVPWAKVMKIARPLVSLLLRCPQHPEVPDKQLSSLLIACTLSKLVEGPSQIPFVSWKPAVSEGHVIYLESHEIWETTCMIIYITHIGYRILRMYIHHNYYKCITYGILQTHIILYTIYTHANNNISYDIVRY